MRTLKLLLAAAILIAAGGRPLAADENEPGEGIAELFDDRLVIRLAPGVDLDDFVTAFEATYPVTLEALDVIPGRPIHLLHLETPPEFDPQSVNLEAFPQLAYGDFLYSNGAPEGHTGSVFVDAIGDPFSFGNQFAADTLGLDAAHAESTGQSVVVAVLDTGIDAAHPELADNVLPGGYNFVDGNTDTADGGEGLMVGHGTFVAGLIALTAPDVGLLPVKVLDPEGRGDGWILAQALFFAIDQGVHVVNLSLGSTYDEQVIEDAIDEARSKGIVVVAAAGNLDRCEPREFPAMKSDPIGVAAVNDQDVKAPFSNFHDKIAISAPGATFFLNGDPQQPDPARAIIGPVPGGGYAAWGGTSMAVPFVTGAAALVRARCDQWPACEATANEIANRLTGTAVNIDNLPGNVPYQEMLGSGRLDIAAAMAAAPACGPACPFPPCDADVTGDGSIGVEDLVQVILDWGPCPGCAADVDGDGAVAVADLVAVILSWGPCQDDDG